MKTLMIVTLALTLPLQAAIAATPGDAPASATVAGQKIDSGLGELPHYRLWADPSGKNPVAASVAVKVQDRNPANAQHKVGVKAAGPASTQVAGLE